MQSKGFSEQQKRKKQSNQGKKGSNTHQADEIKDQNDNNSNIYQADSVIIFASMATISSLIYSLSSKPLVIVLWLANLLSIVHIPQSGPIQEP